jgi:ATP-dependent RNA helicase DeaD
MEEFKKLGLSQNIIKTLEKKGYTTPTPIQAQTIPLLLNSKFDVVGHSQTGTGKTASFALPIIEKLKERASDIGAIILAPTRELAVQVSKEIESLKGEKDLKVLAVYGGSSIRDQISQLRRGVDIVVGTPGRILDLINRQYLELSEVKFAVLDEADEMLNMGFVEDIKTILSKTNDHKKMLLFSATMPRQILQIAKRFMKEYKLIEIEKKDQNNELIEQIYYDISARNRVEGLKRIIDLNPDFHGIIFCNTRNLVDTTAQHLIENNHNAAALHGDISQAQREKILKLFRKKIVNILIATDVAARGIDVEDLTHVINYSLPQSPESYVHRIGRTGRAGKKGIAITFVIPSEKRKLKFIERIAKTQLIRQELPSVDSIIKIKKNKIKEAILTIIEKKKSDKFNTLAKDLLAGQEPQKVVSSILKYLFKNELDPSNYGDLNKVSGRSGSRSGGRDRPRRDGRSRDGHRSSGRDRPRRDGHRSNDRSDRPRRDGQRSGGRSDGQRRDGHRSGGRSEGQSRDGQRSSDRSDRPRRDGQRSGGRSEGQSRDKRSFAKKRY